MNIHLQIPASLLGTTIYKEYHLKLAQGNVVAGPNQTEKAYACSDTYCGEKE